MSRIAAFARLLTHLAHARFTRCTHYDHSENVLDGPLEKMRYEETPDAGVWHVHHLENAHHFSIAPFWLATESQKAFWTDLGHWLRAIDHAFQDSGDTDISLPSES